MKKKIGSYITHTGKEMFSFGKYKHKSVLHILQTNPAYIAWSKKVGWIFSKYIENEIIRLNIT